MNTLHRVFRFYADGFRNMTVGRTLWAIIILKLVVIFGILRVFFFHDYIAERAAEGEEAAFVHEQIINAKP